jgi:hypothetical protein
MSDHDYPSVMPGKLQLDPMPSLPPRPEETATPHIDMGVTSSSHPRFPTGGLPPWLSPELMGPMFEHYAHGLDDSLKLPADFPGPAKPGSHGRWGKNDAGLGVTTRDWQIGGMPRGETSDRFDSPGTRARAERVDQDERDARSRGETAPNPVGDLIRK